MRAHLSASATARIRAHTHTRAHARADDVGGAGGLDGPGHGRGPQAEALARCQGACTRARPSRSPNSRLPLLSRLPSLGRARRSGWRARRGASAAGRRCRVCMTPSAGAGAVADPCMPFAWGRPWMGSPARGTSSRPSGSSVPDSGPASGPPGSRTGSGPVLLRGARLDGVEASRRPSRGQG